MKKIGFLIPIILILCFSWVSTRLYASGAVDPSTLIIITMVLFGVLILFRPKSASPKPAGEIDEKVRGDFAKDAFTDDSQISAKFQSALKDYSKNMPKSALNKLTKLSSQCRSDQEVYAVAMATALCCINQQNYKEAIRQYNKAIVLHPTSELALTLGSCQQRLGQLSKAQDSYGFALDLDAGNLEARSALATTYVADGDYETALEQAKLVLEKNEAHASALATSAICYGLLNDPILSKHYTKLAVENGYKEKKITDTISALKKR